MLRRKGAEGSLSVRSQTPATRVAGIWGRSPHIARGLGGAAPRDAGVRGGSAPRTKKTRSKDKNKNYIYIYINIMYDMYTYIVYIAAN